MTMTHAHPRAAQAQLDAARRRCLLVLLSGAAAPAAWAFNLSSADATAGLRAALEQGAKVAVSQLGAADGFLGNDALRIPLPGWLEQAGKFMRTLGQGQRVDELVTAMNRAAEAAVPAAQPLLLNAIKGMKVADAQKILAGGDTSVTEFFSEKTRAPLTDKFLPIITKATQKVDLASKANRLIEQASKLGLSSGGQSIEQHVNTRAVDGLFTVIGEQEKKIRQDPVGTGSAILGKVFGSLR
jgi:hypothetical protein